MTVRMDGGRYSLDRAHVHALSYYTSRHKLGAKFTLSTSKSHAKRLLSYDSGEVPTN